MRAWIPFLRGFAGNVRFAGGAILEHKLRSTLTVIGNRRPGIADRLSRAISPPQPAAGAWAAPS